MNIKKAAINFLLAVVLFLAANIGYAEEFPTPSATSFEVSSIFSDNMVLQQNETIHIWGTSDDEESIILAKLDDSYGYCKVEDGKWDIYLAPRSYSKDSLRLEIFGSSDAESRVFENITIGDVWLVIGQSNVEYRYGNITPEEALEKSGGEEKVISLLTFGKRDLSRSIAAKHADEPQSDFPDTGRVWLPYRHGANINASALGMCLASELSEISSSDIPIGIISLGFSGAELSAFVQPEISKKLSGYDKKSCIYNSFISPLLQFPAKGIVWYQGEANAPYYSEYTDGFVAFVNKLREDMNKNLPIYIVELPPCFEMPDGYTQDDWQYEDYGSVRAMTGTAPKYLENTYICPTSDLWSDRYYPNNLHPYNKHDIAARLARMIAGNEWGYYEYETLIAPTVRDVFFTDESETKCNIYFDNVGSNLMFYEGSETGFDVIGENWGFVPIQVEITGKDKVTITSSEKIYIIRYGANTNCVFGTDKGLCNSSGTPAAAFYYTANKIPTPYIEYLHIAAVKVIGVLYPARFVIIPVIVLFIALGVYMIIRKKALAKDNGDK